MDATYEKPRWWSELKYGKTKRYVTDYLSDTVLIVAAIFAMATAIIDFPAQDMWLMGGLGLTTAIIYIIKYATKIDRPNKKNKLSFPSGHCALMTVIVSWLLATGEGSPVAAIVLLIWVAWQRVAYDHHRIIDVAGGVFLGTLVGTIMVVQAFIPAIL